jgi:hypothetical protein
MKLLRTLVAVLLAYLIAYVFTPTAPLPFIGVIVLPVVIIFAVLFGILAFVAVDRRERLKEAVAIELNKMRRIYHLGKNLGASPHLRGWFTDLHGFVYDYLGGFEKYDLSEYDKGNALFRRIAYHVYTVPDLREVKEQVLYTELLAATALVSDARQRIVTLHKNGFTKGHWFEFLVMFLVFVATVVAGTADLALSRFATANILAAGAILAMFFIEHDAMTKDEDRELAKEYVKDIARLELRRG